MSLLTDILLQYTGSSYSDLTSALKSRILERSRGEEAELAAPGNHYLSKLNDLYRPWIMKCGLPYLVVDTEAVDFRAEEGLERVIEGIVDKVPGSRVLFD